MVVEFKIIRDQASRLIQTELTKRKSILLYTVNKILRKTKKGGMNHSSPEIKKVRAACNEEINTNARIVWDSIQSVHHAYSAPVTATLAKDLKKEMSHYIEKAVKEARGLVAKKQSCLIQPNSLLADLESIESEVKKEFDVKIDIYSDSLSCGQAEKKPKNRPEDKTEKQSNESQKQVHPQEYLARISDQIDELIIGHPERKRKFCKHVKIVIQEAEKYGRYLREQCEKAKKAGLTRNDENKRKPEWFWWTAYVNDFIGGYSVYFTDEECLNVQFYIKGKPKADPLCYLGSMIWASRGRGYEGLELLDYQFIILAIIHDAQSWQAGRELIQFNFLEGTDLADRLCRAVWDRLEKYTNHYEFEDVHRNIKNAMLAVNANFEGEKVYKADEQKADLSRSSSEGGQITKQGKLNMTLLDEFEQDVKAVVEILEGSLKKIDNWNKDLRKGNSQFIPKRSTNAVIAILEDISRFSEEFTRILTFLHRYFPEFEDIVNDGRSNIQDMIEKVLEKCGHSPLNFPSRPTIPHSEMNKIRRYIEDLRDNLCFYVKAAKEEHQSQKNAGQETADILRGTKQASHDTSKQEAKSARDQVFISYSHKDKRWLEDLNTHLKPYVRNKSLTSWSDKQIASGSKWLSEIKAALNRTKVAVLLVTPNFLASDFIHEHELTPLLQEAEKGGVFIIWIPVRACSYKETTLIDYQAAIDPSKPLANMKAERDKAWVEICEMIKQAVNR